MTLTISEFLFLLAGLLYSYLGMVMALLVDERIDHPISRFIGESTTKAWLVLVFWLPVLPVLYATALWRTWRRKDKGITFPYLP